MAITTNQELLKDLIAAAYARLVVQITYYSPSRKTEVLREVEPYSIIDVDGVQMLKCYQLRPETGWRLFNSALIGTAKVTSKHFQPQRPIVIRVDGSEKHVAPAESRDYEQLEYEKLLQSVIIDLHVDADEVRLLAECRRRYGLSAEEIRGVHYKIFSDCLSAVTKDRIVTDEERQMLIDLNACLRECGAALIQ